MAKTKIHGEYLDPSVISGQTQVTAVGADSMLIFDATDNALKKALLSDLIETVGSTPTFSSVAVDNITIDGTEIDLSSGDLTIDVAGDIILDADGADIIFKDGGTQFGKISKGGGSDLVIDASIADKDIFFTGTDGSSLISALTLDMSNAGAATFNAGATFNELVTIDGGSTANTVLALDSSTANTFLKITDSNTNEGNFIGCTTDDLTFFTRNTERVRINSTGSVGIGIAPETTYSGHVALEIGQQGTLIANRSADDLSIKINTYLDGSGNWKRKETGVASALDFDGDQIKFFTAASGSADANISFVSQLRIDNDGIKFGSDTAAANALDDYEEGTWTPTINSGTMNTAYGYYTKIGRQVTISYYIIITTLGSSTTAVRLGGLPFTSSNAGPGMQTAGSLICRYFTKNQIVSYLARNETNLEFYNNSSSDWDQITFGEIEPTYDADFAAHGTHTYFV